MSLLQLTTYIAAVFFLVVVILKTVKIARMPVHLRWDLYPIPHEKGKAAYGGSYFENSSWWEKPRLVSRAGELREMVVEIFSLRGVFRNNRSLWWFSYPFHIGLYCLVALIVSLKIPVVLHWTGMPVGGQAPGFLSLALQYAAHAFAAAGWTLTLIGGLGLLAMRLFKRDLRSYSRPGDYINLILLIAVSGAGFIAWVTVDRDSHHLRDLAHSLISFLPAPTTTPAATACLVWLTDILLLYFPFTHMTHFIGKFFTYHKVRWEDTPNRPGSLIEKKIQQAADNPVGWSAPHIDPLSTWTEASGGGKVPDGEK
ncbi:MAG: respiratory nitrate reductase subunit gamma [candidate division Zixibacteria bacterium]|nr:respiratory nitrate reductase subunit gamma [candidate division Zixibacteria bacterium]